MKPLSSSSNSSNSAWNLSAVGVMGVSAGVRAIAWPMALNTSRIWRNAGAADRCTLPHPLVSCAHFISETNLERHSWGARVNTPPAVWPLKNTWMRLSSWASVMSAFNFRMAEHNSSTVTWPSPSVSNILAVSSRLVSNDMRWLNAVKMALYLKDMYASFRRHTVKRLKKSTKFTTPPVFRPSSQWSQALRKFHAEPRTAVMIYCQVTKSTSYFPPVTFRSCFSKSGLLSTRITVSLWTSLAQMVSSSSSWPAVYSFSPSANQSWTVFSCATRPATSSSGGA
mmetsp:Transcript_85818/g.262582  ORF Transcript_85818/g.262582 Transcript_85818/m.262582 type:complete len:282 (-) Transcript_85818:447-1292(-)